MTTVREERPLGELFGALSEQTSRLVKKEIELARYEVTRSATKVARDSAMIGAGAVLAYAGLIVALIGVAWLLASLGLPTWVAFLFVGIVVIAVGAGLIVRSWQQIKKTSVVPERTIGTIKGDAEWAKDQTR